MTVHHADFHDRLARIQSGQAFTKATVYVGQETAFLYVPPSRRKGGSLRQLVANAGYALSLPFCIAVGFTCHALERLLAYSLGGMPDPQANPDVEMAKIAVTGFLLTVVITHLLGLRDKGLIVPKLLGVAAGMLFFHNVVHLWPDLFERVFSPMWVAHTLSSTEPQSLLWRGISFPF